MAPLRLLAPEGSGVVITVAHGVAGVTIQCVVLLGTLICWSLVFH